MPETSQHPLALPQVKQGGEGAVSVLSLDVLWGGGVRDGEKTEFSSSLYSAAFLSPSVASEICSICCEPVDYSDVTVQSIVCWAGAVVAKRILLQNVFLAKAAFGLGSAA